ncbi:MAG: hypothetical protein HQL52_12495 [Magnetococcales bacterium]|nr:hypothetical protein [Magnetococcales bacterium]
MMALLQTVRWRMSGGVDWLLPLAVVICFFIPELAFGQSSFADKPSTESSPVQSDTPLHHQLTVVVDPLAQSLEVWDTIHLPQHFVQSGSGFVLHKDLELIASHGFAHLSEEPIPGTPFVRFLPVYPKNPQTGMDGDANPGEALAPLSKSSPSPSAEDDSTSSPSPLATQTQLSFHYQGHLNFQERLTAPAHQGGRLQFQGAMGPAGLFLGGASGWVPVFDGEEWVTFDLTISLPAGWTAVSQGKREMILKDGGRTLVRFVMQHPTDEILVLAAPWTEYARTVEAREVQVFLLTPDKALAEVYLSASHHYLDFYESLLGPYPYDRFAVVENFQETGLGMPSFTLLGSRVLRLPFIPHTSLPHEILHNWWGNGVFVDYEQGNWGEGLTTYLADYLLQELTDQGAAYRGATLSRYTDMVGREVEFPLSRFFSRIDHTSQSVGYGKSLMVFHMLRRKVGDIAFLAGLRAFYRDHLFHKASWEDLRRAMEDQDGRSLKSFFTQWVQGTGVPELRLSKVSSKPDEEKERLSFTLEQIQPGPPMTLSIPLGITLMSQAEEPVVSLESSEITGSSEDSEAAGGAVDSKVVETPEISGVAGDSAGSEEAVAGDSVGSEAAVAEDSVGSEAAVAGDLASSEVVEADDSPGLAEELVIERLITLTRKRQRFELELDAPPKRLDVDPGFDLFRRLDPREMPPSLSRAFGGKNGLLVLPDKVAPDKLRAYQKMAHAWELDLRTDVDLMELPEDRSIWLLGWHNRFRDRLFSQLKQRGVVLEESGLQLNSKRHTRVDHSFVLTAPYGDLGDLTLVWLAADSPAAISRLTRKLPHYGKYGFLVFQGADAVNLDKGGWGGVEFPLSAVFDQDGQARPATLSPTPPRISPLAKP